VIPEADAADRPRRRAEPGAPRVSLKETKMRTPRLLSASVIALAVGTTASHAVTQDVIDQIVADLTGEGFVRIEIDIERNGTLDVDAYGGGREGDFYYDSEGNLIRSEIEDNAAYGTSYSGGDPASVDVDYDDDDYDDDDDDDDYDDDDDDDDHDDDHGDDHDDDHDDDDDHGDDDSDDD
jgi:hypothetical protein